MLLGRPAKRFAVSSKSQIERLVNWDEGRAERRVFETVDTFSSKSRAKGSFKRLLSLYLFLIQFPQYTPISLSTRVGCTPGLNFSHHGHHHRVEKGFLNSV